MTAKRYSAGAIFLQVVPVFANVQRAIEDEAKTIDRALGDQMERSGERAGERAGKAASKKMSDEIRKADIGRDLEKQILTATSDIEKALSGINTKNLGKKLRGEIAEMRTELKALSDVDINVDDNLDKVRARVEAVKATIEDMRSRSKVFFDIKGLPQVYRDLSKVQATIDAIDGDINIDVDTKGVERKLGAFEKKFKATSRKAAEALSSSVHKEARKVADDLNYLSNLRIGIDISSTMARREIKEIGAELKKLTTGDNDIDLRVDSGVAMAELAEFEAILAALDGDDVEVDVKTNARKAGRDANDAANSFRSFNGVLLAATSVGPALIPVLAGIAGALVAIGPAAAVAVAGMSSVLIGFSGLGDAVTALQNQQDSAATTAQQGARAQVSAARSIENAQEALSDARRNAARAAEDAAEAVADAREAAADAIEDALERQKDAQEDYRDAVQDVADAEEDLRNAREEARKDAESLAKRQRQNAVDERQAILDLGEAQNQFNAVMADGSSTDTDKEQASVNLEQAQIALNNTRDEQVALAEEAADYAKNGVDGSDKVRDAQDAVTEALEAQKDAQDAVKEAAEAADEARVEGAERVNEALEDQRETLSDNARAIGRAKEALSDARRQAVEDLSAINSQQQAVNAAFDKLGPSGRKFALFLFGLRSGFYEFRDAVQEAMLPAVQKAIEGFIASPAADKARVAFVALAAAFGDFALALSESFQGKAWTQFFEMLAELGPDIQKAYGDAFISFMEAFASILTTTAPFALRFAEGLAKMVDGFSEWADSKEGRKAITDFLGYVEKVGPDVIDFFSGLAAAAGNVLRAMAPYAEVVLSIIDGLLDFISKMDPAALGAIISAFTIILLASQTAYLFQNAMNSLGALFATGLGPWVFLIVGIAAALIYLYQTNEDFAEFIDKAWAKIRDVFTEAWHKHIKPALTELWDALKVLWHDVLEPFLVWLEPILMWVIENLLPLLLRVFAEKINRMAWIITNILVPAAKWIGRIFKWVWENVLKPVWDDMSAAAEGLWAFLQPIFKEIGKQWDLVLRDMKWVWKNVLEPIWNAIANTALPALELAFETVIGRIGELWDGLRALVANPIKFVIEKVINGGLIAGFNKVSGWVNGPNLDNVPVPEALNFATGGILPGYTPGRDVHNFVSPTGGRLNLSGGEAIMRPEWTQVMGSGYVDHMNTLARQGGASAIRKAMGFASGGIMQAFAKGGIFFPVPGGYIERTDYNLGHDGVDINHPNDASGRVPFYSATSGRVTSTGYSRGYGNAVFVASPFGELVYGHGVDGSIRVSPGQSVGPGTPLANIGNTGNSSGPHLHFGIPGSQGGTFARAMAILGGTAPLAGTVAGGDAQAGRSIPSWLMSFVKDPLAGFKSWITAPLKMASDAIKSPFFDNIAKVPGRLGKAVVDKAWDIIPGWVKTTAGWAGDAAEWAVGGVKNAADAVGDAASSIGSGIKNGAGAVGDFLGFADGGILPYNGTMMYDNGGYLAPGLTTVMNLTGKPEPVFTSEQFDNLGIQGGDGFTYAPVINGSDLTAADLVDDLEFSRRKMKRQGRYERNQT